MPAFDGLIIVVAVAFAAPFALGLFPSARLPSIVLEIIAGIVIGPSILGWVEVDQSIEVISLIGLAFLLFLAGLEIAASGHLAPLHRRRDGDRRGVRLGHGCRGCGPDRRRASLRPALPRHRPGPAAGRRYGGQVMGATAR